MNIDQWVSRFSACWIEKNIEGVLDLFTEDVEYWETSFKRLASFQEIRDEWQAISGQRDIQLKTELFSSVGDKHVLLWKLDYLTQDGALQHWAGTYLIRLNEQGLCTYFLQTGEYIS